MNTLYDELTTGPLSAEIAPLIESGDDGAIAAIMARQDIPVMGKLTSHNIRQYLMLYDLLLTIESSGSMACREASRALEIFPEFDLSNPYVLAKFTSILDGLIADSLVPAFTETNKQNLLGMAINNISRVWQTGLDCSINSIAQALRG